MDTRYGSVRLKVPKGFPILLQRFAREVLREQPEDIAKFGAEYFRTLVDHRNSTGEDPLKADPFDEPGYHAGPKKVLRPISSETRQNEIQEDNAAARIQAGYRGYRVRKQSRQERDQRQKKEQEVAATRIQARYRGYRTRRCLSAPEKITETSEPQEKNAKIEEEQEPQYGNDESNAAIRIQANFRGYQARKSLKSEKAETEKPPNQEDTREVFETEAIPQPQDENHQEKETAALKIQATYRGHKTRKHLKETRTASLIDEAAQLTVTEEVQESQVTDDKPTEADTDPEDVPKKVEDVSQEAEQTSTYDEEIKQDEETADNTEEEKLAAAALKIQASYRGHMTRKQLKENDDKEESPKEEKADTDDAPKTETADTDGAGGDAEAAESKPEPVVEPEDHETQDPVSNKPESAGDSAEPPKEVNKADEAAAVKIQSQYRGYRTRKQLKSKKVSEQEESTAPSVGVEQVE